MSLTARIKRRAHGLGFDLVGVAPAVTPEGVTHLREWLQRGYEGEMAYMRRQAAARAHPRHVLDGVRSIIVAAMNYRAGESAGRRAAAHAGGSRSSAPADAGAEAAAASPKNREPPPSRTPRETPLCGRVSSYAWGDDYHGLLRGRLNDLLAFIRRERPGTRGRAVVDTAPLLERDFARLAGIGWIGKNTMLLSKRFGSWLFLGALLVDIELEYDAPHAADHCGTCTRCLDACPTHAFAGPYQLDSRRCVSYLTIELRGPIPHELREGVGDWLFGCDVCQEVCPWNRKAPAGREPALQPRHAGGRWDLIELLAMSDEALRDRLRGSTLTRPGLNGLRRNAAIVLGNIGDPAAAAALEHALGHPDADVRDAAAWALQRCRGGATR